MHISLHRWPEDLSDSPDKSRCHRTAAPDQSAKLGVSLSWFRLANGPYGVEAARLVNGRSEAIIHLTASPRLSCIDCRVSKNEDALRERDTGPVRTLSYGHCPSFRYRGGRGSRSKRSRAVAVSASQDQLSQFPFETKRKYPF